MYGQAGAGGTTQAGSGGSASAGSPATDTTGTGIGAMMMQAQLLKAQKENIEADTEQKQADTEFTRNQKSQEAEARTLDLTQGIKNKQATELLTKAQTKLQELNNEIRDATANVTIQEITWTSQYALEKLQQAQNDTYISNETRDDKVKQIGLNTILMSIEVEAKEKGIKLTDAQINSIKNTIQQNWQKLEQGQIQLDINEFNANMNAEHPSLWNVIGGEAKRSINILNQQVGNTGGYYRKEK